MTLFASTSDFVRQNQDLGPALVRVYLGVGLFAKGVFFINHTGSLNDLAQAHHIPFASLALVHYIALAHLGGGLLLAIGLLTRVAAVIQLPILFGAVFFVHWSEGLFGAGQGVAFAGLVLALLAHYAVFGGGRWSADEHVFRRAVPSAAERQTSVWPA